jgi:hypothetical protein
VCVRHLESSSRFSQSTSLGSPSPSTRWISKPLTLDEWGQLDEEESELLSKIVGDHFSGTAGPMPFGEEWQKAREEWDRAGKVQDESP